MNKREESQEKKKRFFCEYFTQENFSYMFLTGNGNESKQNRINGTIENGKV